MHACHDISHESCSICVCLLIVLLVDACLRFTLCLLLVSVSHPLHLYLVWRQGIFFTSYQVVFPVTLIVPASTTSGVAHGEKHQQLECCTLSAAVQSSLRFSIWIHTRWQKERLSESEVNRKSKTSTPLFILVLSCSVFSCVVFLFSYLLIQFREAEGLESIPAVIGQKAGTRCQSTDIIDVYIPSCLHIFQVFILLLCCCLPVFFLLPPLFRVFSFILVIGFNYLFPVLLLLCTAPNCFLFFSQV